LGDGSLPLASPKPPRFAQRSCAALAWFLAAIMGLGAGCLEATPPPVKGHGDASSVPPPASDASSVPPASDAGDAGLDDLDGAPFVPSDAGAAAWAGTWTYTSGSQGILCGGSLAVVAVSGFLDITPSGSGSLLSVKEDGCTFHFVLAGDVATSDPDQACAAWAIPTIPIWTLTMQADGTLREMLGGHVLVNGEICTISGGSTLARQ
jgi:hypothetical protein